MRNAVIGVIRLADYERRKLKEVVTFLFLFHFSLLFFGETLAQGLIQEWRHPVYPLGGLAWWLAGVLACWWFGGWPFDICLGMYIGTNNTFFRALGRVFIAFWAIELFVVMAFTLIPFYTNPWAFGLAAVSVALYFILRHLAGEEIHWENWVWLPATTAVVGFAVCLGAGLISLFSR